MISGVRTPAYGGYGMGLSPLGRKKSVSPLFSSRLGKIQHSIPPVKTVARIPTRKISMGMLGTLLLLCFPVTPTGQNVENSIRTAILRHFSIYPESPEMVYCMADKILPLPLDFQQTVTRPRLDGTPSLPAYQLLQRIQRYQPLHAIETRGRLEAYLAHPEYSAVDMDVRVDEQNRVRVGHSGIFQDSPAFEPWLLQLLSLSKTGVVKIDVKEPAAVSPLIETLKRLDADTQILTGRVLILNADIPLGASHQSAAMSLTDLKKLRNAFPAAVVSLGIDASVTQVDDKLLQDIDYAFAKLGGINTVAFHYTTQLNETLFQHLEARNGYMTIWANAAARGCISDAMLNKRIPEPYRDKIWLDFPNPLRSS
jgi:hypothetical protein